MSCYFPWWWRIKATATTTEFIRAHPLLTWPLGPQRPYFLSSCLQYQDQHQRWGCDASQQPASWHSCGKSWQVPRVAHPPGSCGQTIRMPDQAQKKGQWLDWREGKKVKGWTEGLDESKMLLGFTKLWLSQWGLATRGPHWLLVT